MEESLNKTSGLNPESKPRLRCSKPVDIKCKRNVTITDIQ